MGSCCPHKEFLKELDYCTSEMTVWGTNYDIMQTVFNIQRKVKEFYPPNGIPQDIMDSMKMMEERMKIATEQLCITCNRIMLDVEKQRREIYPNA